MDDGELIADQIAYYRARAAEYDETSMPEGDPYATHGYAIRDALRAFDPRGRVLEIAAGTGQWTGILADHATELVVTDASPEMLVLNAAKVGERAHVQRAVADAFSLPASHDFDVVLFGFFLSHVPPARFAAFWDVIAGALAPGGRVFFTAEAWPGVSAEDWIDPAACITRRGLLDGSPDRAVKVLWRPAELEARLTELGWDASVHPEGPFYWGSAEHAASRA